MMFSELMAGTKVSNTACELTLREITSGQVVVNGR